MHGIISIGNPLLWWASVPALVALVVLAFVRRDRELILLPLIVALLYLPWLSTTRTSFMYYMTPVAPFMALAVATVLRELSGARLPRPRWALLCFAASAAIVALLWYQIGQLAAWWFWRLPHQALARLRPRRARRGPRSGRASDSSPCCSGRAPAALWRYLTWVYAGAVAGVCLAFLPILIDLSISTAHFYHLMWFRNWI